MFFVACIFLPSPFDFCLDFSGAMVYNRARKVSTDFVVNQHFPLSFLII